MKITDIIEYIESFKDDPKQLGSLWYYSGFRILSEPYEREEYNRTIITTYVLQNPESDDLLVVSLSPFAISNEISVTFRYFFNGLNLEFINSDLDEDIDYYEF